MKPVTLAMIAASISAPMVAGLGVEWLGIADVQRVAGGEDVDSVAEEIARREFAPDVRLRVLDARDEPSVRGDLGDTYRAPPGATYRHLTVEVANRGRLDVAVHTYHFSALDDAGRRHKAQLGLEEKFETMRVQQGEATTGVVVFLVPTDALLARLQWQGELHNATLEMAPLAPPPASRDGPWAQPAAPPQEKPDP